MNANRRKFWSGMAGKKYVH